MGINHSGNRQRSRADRGRTKRKVRMQSRHKSAWLTVFPEDDETIEHEETAEDDEPDAPRTQPLSIRREQRRR
jgi:hypothetical protein